MTKKATLDKLTRKASKATEAKAYRERIAATIAKLDHLKPKSAKAAKAIALFKSWLADESGYDEETWPKLKKALNRERDDVGARRLFSD
jgi:hypothetical protein